MPWASTFTGRADELTRLSLGVRKGWTTVVTGDPGIGKTRLVAECAAEFSAQGWLVVSAPCLPLAEQLPLLPVLDGLRQLHGTEDGTLLLDSLEDCPLYVRQEIARVVPELTPATGATSENWPKERLFYAVLQCWTTVRRRRPMLIIIEDLHWSDSATRDFLTYLAGRRASSVPVVLTARLLKTQDDGVFAAWTEAAASTGRWQRIRLPPLEPSEVEFMAASVATSPLTADQNAALIRRCDGNPFFVEQLVAADVVTTLSEDLAEMLRSRATATTPEAHDVLRVLAVAGRPLSDDELAVVSGHSVSRVREALRELVGAALARLGVDGLCSQRHALLGEAVEAGLFAGERAELHAAVAGLLLDRGDASLAPEAAHHLRLAGRKSDELPVRIAAAKYCEHVGGFAESSLHWSRAVELAELFDDEHVAELALRGVRAAVKDGAEDLPLNLAERGKRAANRHGQRQLFAAINARTVWLRVAHDQEPILTEMEAAVEAFQGLPPSAEQVDVLCSLYWAHRNGGNPTAGMPALRRAVELEKALAGNSVEALVAFSHAQLVNGEVEAGLAAAATARQRLGPETDLEMVARVAVLETDINLKLNRLTKAATDGLVVWNRLQAHGWAGFHTAAVLLSNVSEALRHLGRIDQVKRLLEPLTSDRTVGLSTWFLHEQRCWVDLCGGRLESATARLNQLLSRSSAMSSESQSDFGQLQLEVAVWSGNPVAALDVTIPILINSAGTETEGWAARLLTSAMRACADLVEGARARRDNLQLGAGLQISEKLQTAHADLPQDPFAEHPFFVTATAEGVEWVAELNRCRGVTEPELWLPVARRWRTLGRPHRAAYAWWRAAQALLHLGRRGPAASALAEAHQLSDQHVPLTDAINQLARFSRIQLRTPSEAADAGASHQRQAEAPFGLTSRELDVLRLLTDGLTNAEIGTRLYMSPKTASVHVSAILRKLQAANRVHAATIAERLGLTHT